MSGFNHCARVVCTIEGAIKIALASMFDVNVNMEAKLASFIH